MNTQTTPCSCGWPTCDFAKPGEACWGSIHAVDEVPVGDDDYTWVHACEGHDEVSAFVNGAYIPPPATPDTDKGA